MELILSVVIGAIVGIILDSVITAVAQSKKLPQHSQRTLLVIVSTVLWILLVFRFGLTPQFWGYGIIFSGLLYTSAYDILYKHISDVVVGILILGGLLFGVARLESVILMVLGGFFGLFFFVIQYVLSKGKWVGGGDIWMGVLVGVLTGWPLVLLSLAVSYIFAGLVSLWLLLAKRATWKSELPFAPFLSIGVFIILLYTGLLLAVVGRF